jgi:hypothetical protein
MAAIPGGNTRRVYGAAFHDGARWWARVGDNLLDARWNASVRPEQGLSVVVDITNDGQGQSTALVMCAYVDQPTPATGTIQEFIPAGPANSIVFQADDGIVYQTDQVIEGTYNLGDPIYLNWDANKPTIIGKIGALAAPPPPAAPPAENAGAGNGQAKRITSASDTWWGPGGWGSWATSRGGGEDVYSGSQGGGTVTGAWFYGAPDPVLAGKTVNRIQFYLPARLPGVGGYNSTATIHLYAHDSWARPGGDVVRVTGPHDVNVIAGFRGGFIDLPLTFAPALVAGGGISIAGNPYIGFESRLDNPEAGKLLIDWTA